MTTTAPAFSYVTGGTLPPDSPSYITRPCDDELLKLCLRGEFAYVLSSRQMGKSSLMARTVAALQRDGLIVAAIDLTSIGSQLITPESWYLGVLTEIDSACKPQTDLFSWWEVNKPLPLAQRLKHYIAEVLLPEVPGRIVVLIDEIDSTLSLDFTDDFFALIRAFHNCRAQEREFERISFVLLGVAAPSELIRDQSRTPFNIGRRVEITDFTAKESELLITGFAVQGAAANVLLRRVLDWTSGQPYLTQKICALLSCQRATTSSQVDELVASTLLSIKGKSDEHFQFISKYLKSTNFSCKINIMQICVKLLDQGWVSCDVRSEYHNRLLISGLVRRRDGRLVYGNNIYARVFDLDWAREIGQIPGFEYITTGSLLPDSSSYVTRSCDTELLNLCRRGKFAYVIGSKLMGKSSLMSRAMAELRRDKLVVVGIELAEIGSQRDAPEIWYKKILHKIHSSCMMLTNFHDWWEDNKNMLLGQRLWRYINDILLRELSGNIVIFVDDIDLVINLDFARDFFAMIRSLHDQRSHQSEFERISFVLFGVFSLNQLIRDADRMHTLFNVGQRVELTDFSTEESRRLLAGLGVEGDAADALLERVLYWTGGQPYLTQKLCSLLSASNDLDPKQVDLLVKSEMLNASGRGDSLFKFVEDRLLETPASQQTKLIDACVAVLKNQKIAYQDASVVHSRLLFAGLVRNVSGVLFWRNELYRELFGIEWFDQHRPTPWMKVHLARVITAVVAVLVSSVFWLYLRAETAAETEARWVRDAIAQKILDDNSGMFDDVTDDYIKIKNSLIIVVAQRMAELTKNVYIRTAAYSRLQQEVSLASVLVKNIIEGHDGYVLNVAFSPDGKLLASSSTDQTVRLWNTQTGEPIGQPLKGHSGFVLSVAFSPDGRLLASSGTDATIRLWNAKTGQIIGVPLHGHTDWIRSVVFSQDGNLLASGSDDRTVRLWNVQSAQPVGPAMQGHSGKILKISFSHDGKTIASGSADQTIRLWSTQNNQVVGSPLHGHSGYVLSVAYSPDDKMLASGSTDKSVRLWSAQTGQSLGRPLLGHTNWVRNIAFSPDGQLLASVSDDATVRFWGSNTRKPIGKPFQGHSEGILGVTFSPDGKLLASSGVDKTVRLWSAPAAWADMLCAKLPRNMSHKEWREWISPDIVYIKQCPDLPVPAD